MPFVLTYRYRSRDLSFVLSHYYLLYTNQTTSQWTSQGLVARCFVKRFAKLLLIVFTGAKVLVKITRPFHNPLRPSHPTPSTRTSPSNILCLPAGDPRPRVSICGQCTLLHEPRPFTEGPRNATALNNHPPEDRRPCAPGKSARKQS